MAFALPALVLLAAGHGSDSVLAALGSFAVLYGEKRPYLIRWRVITTTGVLLVATAAAFGWIGAWVGAEPALVRELTMVGALGVLTAAGVFVVIALRLGPPGPFFLVLVGGVAVLTGRHGMSPWTLVVFTAAGSLSALVVSMAPMLLRPRGPEEAATEAALAISERFLAAGAGPAHHDGVASSTLNAWSVLHDAAQADSDLAARLWRTHHRVHGNERAGILVAPLPRPDVLRRLRFAGHRWSHATISTARGTASAVAAGAISVAAGLGRPDWAVMGAVLVLQLGPDRIRGTVRGAHRMIGTLAGLCLFAVLHALDLHTGWLIAVLAVLNVLIELTVTTNYALAVTFITPLALLMGSSPVPLGQQMTDRVVETLIGVALAVTSLWLMLPRAHRTTVRAADAAARAVCRSVVEHASVDAVDSPSVRTDRRDLVWLLLEADTAAADSANDEPRWATDYWPTHLLNRSVGYDTLTACWRAGEGRPLPAAVSAGLTTRIDALDPPADAR